MITKKWLSIVGAGVLALGLVACSEEDGGDSGDSGNGSNSEELSGEVLIDGSSTVEPLSSAAAELFMSENSGVNVSVGTSGTGGGFEKFCIGETDLSDASRPISDDEIGVCDENSIAYEQLTVGNDALSVVVHPDNPVNCVTVEQLNAVWGPDSSLSSWSEIEGLEAEFDESLDLFGPGTDSGTFDYFTEAINGEEGAIRTDYTNIGEDDNQGISGVEGSTGGMFFVGYTYYIENQDRVKALQIDEGAGCVEPSDATVQDASYSPLGRGLFVYASDAALAKPEVQAFLEFYINQNDPITEAVGAIALTQEQKDEALGKIAELAG